MKKSIFYLIFLNLSMFAIAQTEIQKKISPTGDFTARQVSDMAIYPGCEEFLGHQKSELQKCFSQSLSNLLSSKLTGFIDKMNELNMLSASAKIQFVVSKEGKLIQIQALSGGTPELASAAEIALREIANEIAPIQPALLEDGDPVNLVFQLPVKIQLANDTNNASEPEFEWNELVLLTLLDNLTKYEVRMTKEKGFKVYEITQSGQIFLGNFAGLNEISQTEPYKTLFSQNIEKTLITEGVLNGVKYRAYNLQSDPSKIVVYKIQDDQEILVETVPYQDFFLQLKYSELIKR